MAKITGRDRLRFVLTKLPKEQRKQLRTAILTGADDIASMQRRLAPFRSGRLRDSIVVTPGDRDIPRYATLKSRRTVKDPELAAIISAGNSKVRYAHLVEFGTAPHENEGKFSGTLNPGTPPRPFFYPGFRAQKKRVQNKINRAARKAIRDGIK
jgi:HK97 gp10 family phage protein